MENENRMIGEYEVLASLWHGGKEYILGEDKSDNSDKPYMTCTGIHKQFIASYENVLISGDYLEIFNIFTERLAERIENGTMITPPAVADCINNGLDENIEGKIIILRASSLSPEYRAAENQIMVALNGNGCRPNARGTAVYCENLYSREAVSQAPERLRSGIWRVPRCEKSRFERYEVAGVADINRLPEWAHQRPYAGQ